MQNLEIKFQSLWAQQEFRNMEASVKTFNLKACEI